MQQGPMSEMTQFVRATKLAEFVADMADETEVIDFILSLATPKCDRTGIAADLISRFGNYSRVIAAPTDELTEIDGVGASGAFLFKLIQCTAQRALRPDLEKPIELSNISEIMGYLQSLMRFEQRETFRVLFLNTKNRVIKNHLISEGTINVVPIFRREIVRQALALSATALILVHNHPSGDPTPSKMDVWETRRLQEACDLFDIKIHDHLVVGNGSWSSLKSLGYI